MKCSLMDFLNQSSCIEGYTEEELREVLQGNKLHQLGDNELMLPNGKTLKCIAHYYANNNNKVRLNGSNDVLNCQIAQRFYEIASSSVCECQACHLSCLNKVRNTSSHTIKI